MKTIRNVALMLALAAGATSLAQAQTPAQAQPAASYHGQSLTRAEVRADLVPVEARRPERFWRGEASPDIYSREYRVAYAEYVRRAAAPSTRPKCSARAGGPIGGRQAWPAPCSRRRRSPATACISRTWSWTCCAAGPSAIARSCG